MFCFKYSFFLDLLALADSIRGLSVASRRVRTSMWSALQATILFSLDPGLAAGDKEIADLKCLKPSEEAPEVEEGGEASLSHIEKKEEEKEPEEEEESE